MIRGIGFLNAFVFLGVGILFFVYPSFIRLGLDGFVLQNKEAVVDFRAIYGGLQIAVGGFLLFCFLSKQTSKHRMGFVLLVFLFSGIFLTRAIGMLASQVGSGTNLGLLLLEGCGLFSSCWGWLSFREKSI